VTCALLYSPIVSRFKGTSGELFSLSCRVTPGRKIHIVAYASVRLLKPECAGGIAWRSVGMLELGVVHMHRIRNQGECPVFIQLSEGCHGATWTRRTW
jgi:hypothetical protein